MNSFEEMDINEVVQLAKNNDRAAYNYIFKRYKGTIHSLIKKKNYFLQGGDYEDLFQEGSIGFYKAVRDFNPENGGFDVFSKIVIDRHLISAIKTSTRKKHTPLNDMIPLDRSLPDNDNLTMMDIFGSRSDIQDSIDIDFLDPAKQFTLNEKYNMQRDLLTESLSDKETAVYELYLEEKPYKEIMEDLGVDKAKTIDNAIQRVRRKIEKIKSSESIENSKN